MRNNTDMWKADVFCFGPCALIWVSLGGSLFVSVCVVSGPTSEKVCRLVRASHFVVNHLSCGVCCRRRRRTTREEQVFRL